MLTAIKEILFSLKDNARERIKNPLIGSFALSWCVYNWDVILRVYLTDNSIEIVISEIKPLIQDPKSYFIPLLFSSLYVSIFPWVTVGIQKLRSNALMEAKRDKLSFELKMLMEKKDIITQEANNEELKVKISKETALSLKEQEYTLDQKIKQSDLDTLLKEAGEEKRGNARERAELEEISQTLKDDQAKLEKAEKEYVNRDKILLEKEKNQKDKKPLEDLRTTLLNSESTTGLFSDLVGAEVLASEKSKFDSKNREEIRSKVKDLISKKE